MCHPHSTMKAKHSTHKHGLQSTDYHQPQRRTSRCQLNSNLSHPLWIPRQSSIGPCQLTTRMTPCMWSQVAGSTLRNLSYPTASTPLLQLVGTEVTREALNSRLSSRTAERGPEKRSLIVRPLQTLYISTYKLCLCDFTTKIILLAIIYFNIAGVMN